MDRYIIKVLFYAACQIWTSFTNLTKSWKKIQDFVSWEKKHSRINKECLNKFFWPKILTTNTLGTNVHKMYECDKNQMPYCNIKCLKSENLRILGHL
jgi:hypothetical protein